MTIVKEIAWPKRGWLTLTQAAKAAKRRKSSVVQAAKSGLITCETLRRIKAGGSRPSTIVERKSLMAWARES